MKYTGWGLVVVGLNFFYASPNSGVALISGVVGILGGIVSQFCRVVQNIQTEVFLRDVKGKTQLFSKNNGYNRVIFFDDNNYSNFKVIKLLEGNSLGPYLVIDYERFGLIKTEKIKVNSKQMFWA